MTQLSPTALEEAADRLRHVERGGSRLDPWASLSPAKKRLWCDKVTAAITAYLAQMEKEGWVLVPKHATGMVKSAICDFVRSRAIPSPSDIDPDDIYFDAGHARELYAVVIEAAQSGGE